MNKRREEIYEFGSLRLDAVNRSLVREEESVPLTAKVFDLLLYLVQNAGRLVTKEELLRGVWPDSFVAEKNLTVNMSALRRALGPEDGLSQIETVSGSGYRFTAKVEIVKFSESVPATKVKSGASDSLAVLPIKNMTGVPALDYLSEGIAESIINNISQLPQLKVVAWSSVNGFSKGNIDVQAVGHQLGVRAVLVGRMFGTGDCLFVAVELVDTIDSSLIWGKRYEFVHTKIFSLQNDIVMQVVEGLRLKLTGGERRGLYKRHTASIKAYQFYLQGRHLWNKRTVNGFWEALKFFERALKEEGNYALAHAGVADCYLLLGGYGAISPQDSIPRIKAALTTALEQDMKLAEAHASLGHLKTLHEWDWLGSERELRLAIKLNPNYATAHHWYALNLRYRGLLDRALEELKLAQELDPLSASVETAIGASAYIARQYEEAIFRLRETLELHPHYYVASAHLGLSYLMQGAYEDAIKELSNMVRTNDDPEAQGILGYALGVSGRVEDARSLLQDLTALSTRRYVDPFNLGIIHMGLGEQDQAFDQFEQALEIRSPFLCVIKVHPLLDSLRSHPRFLELMLRVGFAGR
jgi:DNA-binding winged helix-turn-helix (wHTH) protein/tetratricopeptide (TPR) repeat protein